VKEDACQPAISAMESWIVLGDRMSDIVVSKYAEKNNINNNLLKNNLVNFQ